MVRARRRPALRRARDLGESVHSFSHAVFDWHGHSVGVLDPARLFASLREVGR